MHEKHKNSGNLEQNKQNLPARIILFARIFRCSVTANKHIFIAGLTNQFQINNAMQCNVKTNGTEFNPFRSRIHKKMKQTYQVNPLGSLAPC
jgi:hypothetical protein